MKIRLVIAAVAAAAALALPVDVSAAPAVAASGQYFGLAPPGTSLPRSDAYCAAHIQRTGEQISANVRPNADTPSTGTNFRWGPAALRPSVRGYTAKVDGNFRGTTQEILEWAACKWGWDQDMLFAQAGHESGWHQYHSGINGGLAPGIMSVRVARAGTPLSSESAFGGYPWIQLSTALNADFFASRMRACYNGADTWLGAGYHAGDAWGCVGTWVSGRWSGAANASYIAQVKQALATRAWTRLS